MPELRVASLVLYKTQPARVTHVGKKKIEIRLPDGETLSVRPKDVMLLHPGPLDALTDLSRRPGEIKTAWELLVGAKTTLAELAELAYGSFTPQSAWAAWQWVADRLYFSGAPDEIVVHEPDVVAAEKEARAAKAAEEAAWDAFLERATRGEMAAEDGRFLQEVAALAQAQQEQSRVLRALGRGETPQNAHALLLEVGYWDEAVNPYPQRVGVTTTVPDMPLPDLPAEERRDLTHLLALAIDDAGSQDPDDAVSWEDGRLWVHIADVAALAPPDSPADLEARARGANLYLPEGTVPMLPPGATDLLALGLADVSPAFSFGLDVNNAGQVTDLELTPSWVRVTRLSYAEADERLGERPFQELHRLAQSAMARRRQNGSVQIELPEVKIRVQDGVVVIRPLPPRPSRDLVREAMLLAGEAVARFAFNNGIPIPYTTQEAPESLDESGDTPADMFARRRAMQASHPSSAPGAHAGLGLGLYAQATSPLRRYLDMVIHQQLRAYLRGDALLDDQEVMARVGAADAVSRDVRYAERLSNQHWTLVYLQRRPEWQGEGVVVEQRGSRDRVLIPALALETWIYRREERPLNSLLTLKLNEVNLPELEAHFRV